MVVFPAPAKAAIFSCRPARNFSTAVSCSSVGLTIHCASEAERDKLHIIGSSDCASVTVTCNRHGQPKIFGMSVFRKAGPPENRGPERPQAATPPLTAVWESHPFPADHPAGAPRTFFQGKSRI